MRFVCRGSTVNANVVVAGLVVAERRISSFAKVRVPQPCGGELAFVLCEI